jgi:predicted nucleic acid-binding protein
MVVDASVWVSSLVPDDVNHMASSGWLGRELSVGSILVIPGHAPAEVAGAIARRTGQPALGGQAAARLLTLPSLRIVPIDASLAHAAANVAADHLLRGADAVYATVAQALNLPLVTLDAELQRRAAGFVHVVAP